MANLKMIPRKTPVCVHHFFQYVKQEIDHGLNVTGKHQGLIPTYHKEIHFSQDESTQVDKRNKTWRKGKNKKRTNGPKRSNAGNKPTGINVPPVPEYVLKNALELENENCSWEDEETEEEDSGDEKCSEDVRVNGSESWPSLQAELRWAIDREVMLAKFRKSSRRAAPLRCAGCDKEVKAALMNPAGLASQRSLAMDQTSNSTTDRTIWRRTWRKRNVPLEHRIWVGDMAFTVDARHEPMVVKLE